MVVEPPVGEDFDVVHVVEQAQPGEAGQQCGEGDPQFFEPD
ncbi:hypothetical protein ABZS66_58410 [Dactylosporangium sp. NPDC005572]